MNASLPVQRRVPWCLRQNVRGLDDFCVVWRTTQDLTNVEDNDFRVFLQEAEGHITMIQSQPER